MAKLKVVGNGVSSMQPTLMRLRLTLYRDGSDLNKITGDLAVAATGMRDRLGSAGFTSVVVGRIVSRAVSKSVEKKGISISEKSYVFSHYHASVLIEAETALNIKMLVSVLNIVSIEWDVETYRFSFDIKDRERDLLYKEAIRSAMKDANAQAEFFRLVTNSVSYHLEEVTSGDTPNNILYERSAVAKQTMMEDRGFTKEQRDALLSSIIPEPVSVSASVSCVYMLN